MRPFKLHTGIAAPLLRDNVDTDAIIPSREMNRVSKDGLGIGLFAQWRYEGSGATRVERSDFVLNQLHYRDATILLGGENFGCGSSREHAVWALVDFGIRCVIAPSFGAIFYGNCLSNGVLPVRLARDAVARLAKGATAHSVTVDLKRRCVNVDGVRFEFDIDDHDGDRLLRGVDDIDETLKFHPHLLQYKRRDEIERPWAALSP